MLGSVSEAEDVAQEALLRLTRQAGPIDAPAAWITTVVTRLSINILRSARARRESYVGPWLPEPLLEDPAPGPASRAELADSLSLAMLVLLEQLNPVERVWEYLRDRRLSHRVLAGGYEAVVDAACAAWNALLAEPGRLRSLTSFPWLPSAVSTS